MDFVVRFALVEGRDDRRNLLAELLAHLVQSRYRPALSFRSGQPTHAEVPWDEVDLSHRALLCQEAGLPKALADPDARLDAHKRELLRLTAEEILRVHLTFGGGALRWSGGYSSGYEASMSLLVLDLDDAKDPEERSEREGDLVLVGLGPREELRAYAKRMMEDRDRLLVYRVHPRSVTADRVKVRLCVLIVRERQPDVPDLDRASVEELHAFAARHEQGRCWQELFAGAGRMRGRVRGGRPRRVCADAGASAGRAGAGGLPAGREVGRGLRAQEGAPAALGAVGLKGLLPPWA